MKLEKNNEPSQLEIEVEVEEGIYESRKIPSSNGNYLMLSDIAKELLKYKEKGRVPYIVYVYLLSCRNRRNNQCFPSIATICNNLYMTKNTVKSAITFLEDNGFIIINSGHSGLANNYYFPKEYFYEYFKDDIKQTNANRVIRKETKKTIEQLEKEKKKHQNKIVDINKQIDNKKKKNMPIKDKLSNLTSSKTVKITEIKNNIQQKESEFYIHEEEELDLECPFEYDDNPFD